MSKVFDIDNWREIGITLSRNKTRTILTGFGIFWGTAMLAMLLGGASGFEGMLSRQFAGFATNMVFMSSNPTTVSYKGYNKGMEWSMNDRDIAVLRSSVPYIDASTSLLSIGVNIDYKNKTKHTSVIGIEADYFKIMTAVLYKGRFLNAADIHNYNKTALIGRDLASELFGEDDPLGKNVTVNGVSVQIVGVVGQKGEASVGGRLDWSIVMPFTTLRRAFNWGDKVWFFIFTLEPGHRLNEIKDNILHVMRMGHPISPDDTQFMAIGDVAEQFQKVESLFLAITLLAGFVGVGTLIAGIIGVGNIMWIIVKERTQEIGIRRAIGARPRDIIAQILSEGVVLTSIAGLAGISFATFILAMADKATFDPLNGSAGFEMSFATAVIIMIIFLVLGTLAGLIPAVKAMRIKPIEAINDK